MARGNQRDKAREKTQKDQAAQVYIYPLPFPSETLNSNGSIILTASIIEEEEYCASLTPNLPSPSTSARLQN